MQWNSPKDLLPGREKKWLLLRGTFKNNKFGFGIICKPFIGWFNAENNEFESTENNIKFEVIEWAYIEQKDSGRFSNIVDEVEKEGF